MQIDFLPFLLQGEGSLWPVFHCRGPHIKIRTPVVKFKMILEYVGMSQLPQDSYCCHFHACRGCTEPHRFHQSNNKALRQYWQTLNITTKVGRPEQERTNKPNCQATTQEPQADQSRSKFFISWTFFSNPAGRGGVQNSRGRTYWLRRASPSPINGLLAGTSAGEMTSPLSGWWSGHRTASSNHVSRGGAQQELLVCWDVAQRKKPSRCWRQDGLPLSLCKRHGR